MCICENCGKLTRDDPKKLTSDERVRIGELLYQVENSDLTDEEKSELVSLTWRYIQLYNALHAQTLNRISDLLDDLHELHH